MSDELARITIAIPTDLLASLDDMAARRGTSSNRSEVIRDLIRKDIVTKDSSDPHAEIMGTLTIVFNHHAGDLQEKLDEIQHDHVHEIIATTHVHVDAHNCLEVIIMRGESQSIRSIADRLIGTKGVKHGEFVATTTGIDLH